MPNPWEKYQKEQADAVSGPWTKYSQAGTETSKPGAGKAFYDQARNEITLGHLPQLEAGIEKLLGDPTRELDAKLRAQGFAVKQDRPSYIENRDAAIQRLQQQQKDFPVASKAGQATGILSSILMPVGATAKGATLGQKLSKAAKVGGAVGLLSNPGDVEGEENILQLDSRLKNAAKGAAIGVAAQGAIEAVGPLARKAAAYFGKKAERKAVAAAGAKTGEFARLNAKDPEGAQKLGRTLLDEGIVTPISTPGKVLKRLKAAEDPLEEKLTSLIQDAEAKIGSTEFWGSLPGKDQEKLMGAMFDPKATAEKLKQEIIAKYRQIPIEKIQPALDEVDVWFKNRAAVMSPAEVQAAKIQMGRFLKDTDFYKQVGIAKEGTLAARRGFKEGVEQNVDTLAEVLGGQGGQIRNVNRKLGHVKEALKIAEKGVARGEGNRAISLTDTIAGVGGLAAGGSPAQSALLSAALAGANKLGRTFGSGLQATGFDAVSRVLQKSPALIKLAQTNPLAVQLLVNRITQPREFTPGEDDPFLKNPQLLKNFEDDPSLLDAVQDPKLKAEILKRLGRSPAENPMQRRQSK
jgi:hypothetical protein